MKWIVIIIPSLFLIIPLQADEWGPPETKDYYNKDSTYFIRITPKNTPNKYWEWFTASSDNKQDFLPEDTIVTPCHAVLLKKTVTGDSIVWIKKLKNRVAPLHAMLSDDGKYFVTFDNWHSVGLGENVFVYYNENGEVLKSHILADISPFPIKDYQRTVSSVWWSCGRKFIDTKRIEICFMNRDKEQQKIVYNLEEQKIE
ncbi:MAG: hypothetical protein V4642_13345 [Bacteroidota bacterium]